MPKTATAPPSDLIQQRKHVAALESERATLPARLRQASADGDADAVQTLLTRREMIPTLIAEGRAARDRGGDRHGARGDATGVLRGRETVHHRPSQLPPARWTAQGKALVA